MTSAAHCARSASSAMARSSGTPLRPRLWNRPSIEPQVLAASGRLTSVEASPSRRASSTCASQRPSAAGSCTSTRSFGPTAPSLRRDHRLRGSPPRSLERAVRQAVGRPPPCRPGWGLRAVGPPARPRRPRLDRRRRGPRRRLRRQVRDQDHRRRLRARSPLPGRAGPGARSHVAAPQSPRRVRLGPWAISTNSRSCGSETTPTRSASPGSCVTKSRGFSTTFGALRAARADFAAVEYDPRRSRAPIAYAGPRLQRPESRDPLGVAHRGRRRDAKGATASAQ